MAGWYKGKPSNFTPKDFHVNSDFLGGGYGVMSDLERGAIRTLAETEELFTGEVRDQRTRDYVEGRFG